MNELSPEAGFLLRRLRTSREAVTVVRRLADTGHATIDAAVAAGWIVIEPNARAHKAAFVHPDDLARAASEFALYDSRRARLRSLREDGELRDVQLEDLTHDTVRLRLRVAQTLALEIANPPAVSVLGVATLPASILDLPDAELRETLAAARAGVPEGVALERGLRTVQVALKAARAAAGDAWDEEALAQSLRARLGSPFVSAADAEKYLTKQIKRRRATAEATARSHALDSHVNLGRYEEAFPLARSLGRRLVAYLGPTNSGKTHAAMNALAEARSGAYLAPLRLLALEGQEALLARGIEASLVTGEERDWRPEARHVASTIELADYERPVEAVVIDEIQMLADPDRGWAWTAALVGAPGRTVYLLGAPEAESAIRRLAAYLGEELEVRHFERKTPLVPLRRAPRLSEVEPGDALIAFSRQGVIDLKNQLAANDIDAAVIYGALGPEVRRREAERFRSGQVPVLVATDAIGMGLNLPIRRVLFTAIEKYDGTRERTLLPSEVRQIAGRAGRFGLAEEGSYGVVGSRRDHERLLAILERDPARTPDRVAIMPSRRHLARAADALETESLRAVLTAFAGYVLPKSGSPFAMADLANALELARWLDGLKLPFRDKATLVFCPVDHEDPVLFEHYRRWTRAIAKGETVRAPQRPRLAATDALQRQESFVRECVLYLWFARAFPDLFTDEDGARDRRNEANAEIIRLLAGRRIARQCRSCGDELPPRHRFPVCDPCFHGTRDDEDDGDDVVYAAR